MTCSNPNPDSRIVVLIDSSLKQCNESPSRHPVLSGVRHGYDNNWYQPGWFGGPLAGAGAGAPTSTLISLWVRAWRAIGVAGGALYRTQVAGWQGTCLTM